MNVSRRLRHFNGRVAELLARVHRQRTRADAEPDTLGEPMFVFFPNPLSIYASHHLKPML